MMANSYRLPSARIETEMGRRLLAIGFLTGAILVTGSLLFAVSKSLPF
jgi:hypothetical protein